VPLQPIEVHGESFDDLTAPPKINRARTKQRNGHRPLANKADLPATLGFGFISDAVGLGEALVRG
jgi:hypothetical protein